MLSIAICALTTLLVYSSHNSFSQKKALPACTQQTFAAFKPLPKIEYECPAGLIESDDRILKLPERAKALRGIVKELEAFSDPAWWQAEVDDLNACEVHGSAGEANHRARP